MYKSFVGFPVMENVWLIALLVKKSAAVTSTLIHTDDGREVSIFLPKNGKSAVYGKESGFYFALELALLDLSLKFQSTFCYTYFDLAYKIFICRQGKGNERKSEGIKLHIVSIDTLVYAIRSL